MSVWITSLVGTQEVLKMILDKYNIESEPDQFAIYVVKDNGGAIKMLHLHHFHIFGSPLHQRMRDRKNSGCGEVGSCGPQITSHPTA